MYPRLEQDFSHTNSRYQAEPGNAFLEALPRYLREAEPPDIHSQAEPGNEI